MVKVTSWLKPGDFVNYLTIKERVKVVHWLCVCECGNEITVNEERLRDDSVVCCGCTVEKRQVETPPVSSTKFYKAWQSMIARCHNPNHTNFTNYGARGIAVCDEWRNDFYAFREYVGDRPEGRTLDRIDNNKGYEPGNVRWATNAEQARNRRDNVWVEFEGERMVLEDAIKRKRAARK